MAEVKLKEELELWEPAEVDNSVAKQIEETDGKGVQSQNESCPSLVQMKEEPVEFSIKQEPLQEFPFIRVIVKSEDEEDESSVLHQTPTEENREETNGAEPGLDQHSESERDGQTENSSDTDDSEDWTPSTGTSTEQIKTEPDDCQGAVNDSGDETKLYQWSECGRTFQFTTSLKGTVRVFKCSLCPMDFIQESHLKSHLRTHTGPFSCWICKNTFTDESSLQSHIRTHTGEKPYHCFICDKRFRHYSFLKTHMRRHSCSECGRKCRRSKLFDKDSSVHSTDRPHVCRICTKTFSQTNNPEDKPFSCSVCERTFSRKICLTSHMLVHSEPLKCPVCEKSFFRQKYVDKHMLKVHPKKTSLDKPKPVPNHLKPD